MVRKRRIVHKKKHIYSTTHIYQDHLNAIRTEKNLLLSNIEFHDENFELLEKTLLDNQYPHRIIKRVMKKTKSKCTSGLKKTNSNEVLNIAAVSMLKVYMKS